MFSDVQIRVGFQPEPQLTFCYMVVSVKLRFMAVSLFATSSQRLTTQSKLCYSTHALLQ
jgi:hypothetical protein